MKQKKIALLIDVDNVKFSNEAYEELYTKLSDIGDIVYGKLYGYNDRKHLTLSDSVAKYGFETAPFMRFKKRFSQLDNRIIVDAIKLNYTKPEIDTYCIVAGDGDLVPLLVELKSSGKTTIDVNTEYQELNYHMFDAHITLKSINKEAKVAKSKVAKPSRVVKAPAQNADTTKAMATQSAVSNGMEQPVNTGVPTGTYSASRMTTSTTTTTTQTPVQDSYTAPEQATVSPASSENSYVEETVYDSDQLSMIIKDITDRYSQLDFNSNKDTEKKVELINDIEALIKEENAKGEGLNSKNADIRQIFVELQNIVDDMKSVL